MPLRLIRSHDTTGLKRLQAQRNKLPLPNLIPAMQTGSAYDTYGASRWGLQWALIVVLWGALMAANPNAGKAPGQMTETCYSCGALSSSGAT
jgi:hypothetical protein